ncbi:MAG: glycosyltransferase [Proteobacteria bacterium]|nr:glycosyltransferase [Pseudomonadota bacterium]
MPAKRLLVVIDEMEVGGSQRQIVHLLTGLDRNRWQPELAYFRNESFLVGRLEAAGIPVHRLPKRGRFDPHFLRDFRRLLRQGNYDLVHAFSLTAELWTVVASWLCRRRPPLIASERNQQLGKPAWYWPIKRFVLWRSAGIIANSGAGARVTAQQTGRSLEFFDTIANGVEVPARLGLAQREILRAEVGVPAGRVFALFVGRLVPQKNLPCLIKAMAMLPPSQRPWLGLVGDGPLRRQAQRLATASGVALDMRFFGERDDATRLMQGADFLVLPSHFEGLSNALLEAMAAGCPAIASAVGGTPELIEHERTGLLFAADDAHGLASNMARLCADGATRSKLSLQARDYVARTYGIAAMVAATAAVYERCLAPTSRRPAMPDPPSAPAGNKPGADENQASAKPNNAELHR